MEALFEFLRYFAYITTILLIATVLLFLLSKPLSERQVQQLARKRRRRMIERYFRPSRFAYYPYPRFKSKLKPDGHFYPLSLDVEQVPSYVANLLKYKKHEWAALVFLKDRVAKLMWANKGVDRTQVSTLLPEYLMVRMAIENDCNVIMDFHNHPASQPHVYRYNRPSEKDRRLADTLSGVLATRGISCAMYVCERGRAYRYHRSVSTLLFPLESVQEEVASLNGTSAWQNIRLHLELFL